MLINLFSFSVFLQQSTKYAVSSEPKNLSGKPSFPSASTFPVASVSTKTLRRLFAASSRTGMNLDFDIISEKI